MMRRRGRRRGGRSQWTMALVPLIVPLLGIMESENRKRGVAKIVHTHWQGSGMKVVIPSKIFKLYEMLLLLGLLSVEPNYNEGLQNI